MNIYFCIRADSWYLRTLIGRYDQNYVTCVARHLSNACTFERLFQHGYALFSRGAVENGNLHWFRIKGTSLPPKGTLLTSFRDTTRYSKNSVNTLLFLKIPHYKVFAIWQLWLLHENGLIRCCDIVIIAID